MLESLPADTPHKRKHHGDKFADNYAAPALSDFIFRETGERISPSKTKALRIAAKNYLIGNEPQTDNFLDDLLSSGDLLGSFMPKSGDDDNGGGWIGSIQSLFGDVLPDTGSIYGTPQITPSEAALFSGESETPAIGTKEVLLILAAILGVVAIGYGVLKSK